MMPLLKLLSALPALLLGVQQASAIEVTSQSGLSSTYDYIVVGAGTAGLAVAARLAENRRDRVLIIEAGTFDENEELIYAPILSFPAQAVGGKYDWAFPSLPQEFVASGDVSVARGKIVGGTSAINSLVFNRGSPADYDSWEKLGNPGWGWEGLLPYFRKSETFTPAIDPLAKAFNMTHMESTHGQSGPIQVTFAPFSYDMTTNFKDACNSLGVETPQDQAATGLGAPFTPSSQDPTTKSRSFSRTGYWDPVADRRNLHILTSTMVTKITTRNSRGTPVATGVEILPDGGEKMTIRARKEVILAAGVIQSPQLLQVSGIGPKALLDSLDIPVVVDLPGVGANLQDHPFALPSWALTNVAFSPANLTANPALNTVFQRMYQTTLTGPWTYTSGNLLPFVPLKTYAENANDLITALEMQNATFLGDNVDSTVAAGYLRQKEVILEGLEAGNIASLEVIFPSLIPALQHPMSRGSIYIDSPDIMQPPKIDWRVFTNPVDRQMLASGIRFMRQLGQTSPMQELGATEGATAEMNSDEELFDFIFQAGVPSLGHPSSTCSMMPLELGGVVDPDLRVYGIRGLRVVDASIFPLGPAAHLQASVYAVAEKAADLIKSRN